MGSWTWTTATTRVDATSTGRVFERLIREFGNPIEIHALSARTALQAMRRAFDQGRDPGTGEPWKKLAANTVAAKGHGTPLVNTGKLRNSLVPGRPGNVYLVSAKRAKVGSRLKTAAIHQWGTRKGYPITARRKKFLRFKTTSGWVYRRSVTHPGVAARPLVGISAGTLGEIDRRINLYLDKINREAAG